MGHCTSECPEKKPKDSSGGSSGAFAIMCFEINESPVEGDLEHHFKEKNLEVHLEAQPC